MYVFSSHRDLTYTFEIDSNITNLLKTIEGSERCDGIFDKTRIANRRVGVDEPFHFCVVDIGTDVHKQTGNLGVAESTHRCLYGGVHAAQELIVDSRLIVVVVADGTCHRTHPGSIVHSIRDTIGIKSLKSRKKNMSIIF